MCHLLQSIRLITLANVMIHSSLKHTQSGLGEGQLTHITNNACTNLTFNVYSPHSFEQLILYAEGPCRNVSRSQRRIRISFFTLYMSNRVPTKEPGKEVI